MGTRPAALCPIARADGSRPRPTVTPLPDSRGASLPSSWSASAARCRQQPWTTGAGMGLAPAASRARGAPGPSPPAFQDAFGQPNGQRRGGGSPVGRLLGRLHAGPGGLLTRVVAPLLTHALAQVQTVPPRVAPGDGLVADRGRCSSAHLARLAQAGVHAGLRVWARQLVDCTPGRPLVTPGVRRTPAVTGPPRARWLKTLGVHAPRVTWWQPKTWPSWRTREALAALPDAWALREGRSGIGRPGGRTRQMPLGTTRLDAEVYRGAALAEPYRQRWQVETSRAHRNTTMPMDVRHGHTVSGVLQELTILAMVDTLGRQVRRPSATLPHPAVERLSCLDALRGRSAPSPRRP